MYMYVNLLETLFTALSPTRTAVPMAEKTHNVSLHKGEGKGWRRESTERERERY